MTSITQTSIPPTIVDLTGLCDNQIVVQQVHSVSTQGHRWDVPHDPVALVLLPEDLHLASLGHDESNSLLANKLLWPIGLVVAVHTGDYRR